MKKEITNFKINGQWFVKHIRNLFYLENYAYKVCRNMILDSLDIPDSINKNNAARDIIFCRKTLDKHFNLIEDKKLNVLRYLRPQGLDIIDILKNKTVLENRYSKSRCITLINDISSNNIDHKKKYILDLRPIQNDFIYSVLLYSYGKIAIDLIRMSGQYIATYGDLGYVNLNCDFVLFPKLFCLEVDDEN